MSTTELDLAVISELATASGSVVGPALSASLIAGGKSNLTYRVTDGLSRWILRRPPLGDYHRGAHDVLREARVMQGLFGSVVPVPEVVSSLDPSQVLGVPTYLMVEVPGAVLRTRDQVAALSTAQRRVLGDNLVDVMVAMHEVDPAAHGLAELGRPEGFLDRQVARWTRQLASLEDAQLAGAGEVQEFLVAHQPTSPQAGIVHGDYRLDNVIVAPDDVTRIAAVLDWEMATLGDPLTDLGTLLSFWDAPGQPWNPITRGLTAFDGFAAPREVAERYLRARSLPDDSLAWYVLFARFKLAVLMEQIAARQRRGETPEEGFEGVAEMPAFLIDQALADWRAGTFA